LANTFAECLQITREGKEIMIKSENINSFIGPEEFKECLAEAMKWYGVYKHGFDQRDLLPTAAYLVKFLLERAGFSKRHGAWVCVNGLKRGRGRTDVRKEIEAIAEVDPYECMVDIYCGVGKKDPFIPLITMECEGAAEFSGEVSKSATSENCDYLWDLFKLLQVSSPFRVFLALCAEKKTGELQRKICELVKGYRKHRNPTDVVYAVVFPWEKLDGETITVQRWSGRESICKEYPMALGA